MNPPTNEPEKKPRKTRQEQGALIAPLGRAAVSAKALRRRAMAAQEKKVKPRYSSLKPPPGQKWMLDEVIAAYLSNEDAVCSHEICEAMIRRAAGGDVRAAEFLANRSQGSPVQKINLDAKGVLTIGVLDSMLPEVSKEEKA